MRVMFFSLQKRKNAKRAAINKSGGELTLLHRQLFLNYLRGSNQMLSTASTSISSFLTGLSLLMALEKGT